MLPAYLTIYEFAQLSSTNEFLLNNTDPAPVLCIAHTQTQGKGQYGKSWLTQPQSALFSLKLHYDDIRQTTGLSLVVGLAIIYVLTDSYHMSNVYIKWPNDIYREDKKLAGILIESIAVDNKGYCIIGVGINIVADAKFASFDTAVDTITLIQRTVEQILHYNTRFLTQGMAGFMDEWQQYDYLQIFAKTIEYHNQYYVANGITTEGYLRLYNEISPQVLSSSGNMLVL